MLLTLLAVPALLAVMPVYPDPSEVAAGVTYGPTGTDYTGTLVSTGGGMSDEQYQALLDAATTAAANAQAAVDAIEGLEVGGGGNGNGDVAVDHDYGGTDALRFTLDDASPIDDALVTAYAGNVANGQTRTGSDGRWISPLMLDAGSYSIVFSKPGLVTQSVDVEVV
jgi:hypothetical protein